MHGLEEVSLRESKWSMFSGALSELFAQTFPTQFWNLFICVSPKSFYKSSMHLETLL